MFEKYLVSLPNKNRIALTKPRTNNNRLAIVVGRFRNRDGSVAPLNNRICGLCGSGDIGDEFHLLYKCPNNFVPLNNRICGLCDSGDIGDEFHLLYKCPNNVILIVEKGSSETIVSVLVCMNVLNY